MWSLPLYLTLNSQMFSKLISSSSSSFFFHSCCCCCSWSWKWISMMGGGSTRVGSSISSPCSGHRTRTQSRSRRSGVPEWCGCGCQRVLRWSGTDSNPNKPFFGCPNYNVSYQYYLCCYDCSYLPDCSSLVLLSWSLSMLYVCLITYKWKEMVWIFCMGRYWTGWTSWKTRILWR